MNELELKRNIFNLFDKTRVLFNDYYNDFWGSNEHYQDKDIEEIKKIVYELEIKIKELKEML